MLWIEICSPRPLSSNRSAQCSVQGFSQCIGKWPLEAALPKLHPAKTYYTVGGWCAWIFGWNKIRSSRDSIFTSFTVQTYLRQKKQDKSMHALINGTRVHYACYLVVSAPPLIWTQFKWTVTFFREPFPNHKLWRAVFAMQCLIRCRWTWKYSQLQKCIRTHLR